MEAAALDSGIMGQYTLKVPSNKPVTPGEAQGLESVARLRACRWNVILLELVHVLAWKLYVRSTDT